MVTGQPTLYQHSGRFSVIGVPLALAGGLGAAGTLAWLYAVLIRIIPIIYADALLCIGFGFLVGFMSAKLFAMFKTRNALVLTGLTLIIAIVGYFLTWGFWVCDLFANSSKVKIGILDFVRHPELLWRLIELISRHGTWSFGHTRTESVNGVVLWICWFCEAALYFGFVVAGTRIISTLPFCECCGTWCKAKERFATVRLPDTTTAPADVERLAARDFSLLEERGRRLEFDPAWLSLDLHRCPTCGQTITLTVRQARLEKDRQGKITTTTKILLNKMLLDPPTLDQLQLFVDAQNQTTIAADTDGAPAASKTTV